jgi:3D (Asp-Asp-Asp) domain-containing protein
VRRPARLQARLLATAFFCAICGALGAASWAATPNASHQRASALRRTNATLAQRIHAATLDLYALDSQLQRVQATLDSLSARRAEITRERQSVHMRLQSSRQDLRIAQRRLALLVHNLYEQQANDPLAVVLGAESLEAAITSLDELGRAGQEHQQIAARSREAKAALTVLTRKLARADAHVRALEAAARQSEAALAATQASRRRYVASLTTQRHLNGAEIAQLDARARSSATKSVAVSPPSVAAATSAAPATDVGADALTVTATGYSMGGVTATGLPVGWGTVAVDPSVIPLGTRLTVPGYGSGVAADTGSAVVGSSIDLWFPTVNQAQAWGRRVVTITLN